MLGRWKDEDDKSVSVGPWYTVRAPVSQQMGKVTTKKEQCGLCELYFLPHNLTGIASWKAVLLKREEWGLQEASQKLKVWAPTRLYNSVKLCAFCAQLVVPDMSTADFPDYLSSVAQSSPKRTYSPQRLRDSEHKD
ncbi:hypothetical protein CYMTET_16455 [Cymbomonas tetramitiformis]|uniref:Uncharacterized protein n=1 Tax=Cymbomonas tetramitiformis TaxID=36881 RepID=A0AAE0L7X2_9CHLO|nr:hypothetical protein CYMTET_16455 [Cymbomonas tetramitiformis]